MDFKLEGKTVVVVGGGSEGLRKTQSFVDSGAKIIVVSKEFSDGLMLLAKNNKVALIETTISSAEEFFNKLTAKPNIFLATTNDAALNTKLIQAAKAHSCIVYSVDDPSQSDFILPAVAKVGDVKIAVSTSGKSPAMAKELRQRIEQLISPEDLLQIELQAYLRNLLKQLVKDQKQRSRFLNDILNNINIKQALKKNQLNEAKELAIKLIESWR